MKGKYSSDGKDHSSQSERSNQSQQSSQTAQSDQYDHSSSDMSGDRRRAGRGEMDMLVEHYIRQGLSAPQIVDRVFNIDRLLTYHGKKLETPRVHVIKNKMKHKEPSVSSEQAQRTDRSSQSDQYDRSDQSQRATQSQQTKGSVRLEDSFRDFKDLPPRKREGRRETRNYAKLNSTVDIEIFKRFEEERIRRRWTATDLMELLLFNAFGHPLLSYSQTEVPNPEEPEAGRKGRKKGPGRTKS